MTSKERKRRDDAKFQINSALAVIGMWQTVPHDVLERAFAALEEHSEYVRLCCSHGIEYYRQRRRELCGY